MRRICVLFTLLSVQLLSSALAATPNEVARYLAGLSMRGTTLEEFAKTPQWVRHAMEMDQAWMELEKKTLGRIRTWAPEYLGPEYGQPGNVYYFFSGPDLLYAQALWPNASNIVLVAREPVGTMPDLGTVSPAHLEAALANLRKSLNAVLSFSFFITQDMKVDLTQTQLQGTLPVLLVFALRAGYQVDTVESVGLDRTDATTTDARPATRGVRIALSRDGLKQNVYYFEADLGDDVLRKNPAVLEFCTKLGPGSTLLKAASYLLHEGGFETVRKWVLAHTTQHVQDDSGIPMKYFDRAKWQLRLCGHYPGPIDIFKQHHQPDLAAAYTQTAPLPMGFSFGYQWQPGRSGLIIARPKPVGSE